MATTAMLALKTNETRRHHRSIYINFSGVSSLWFILHSQKTKFSDSGRDIVGSLRIRNSSLLTFCIVAFLRSCVDVLTFCTKTLGKSHPTKLWFVLVQIPACNFFVLSLILFRSSVYFTNGI